MDGAAAIVLIFSRLGFLVSRLPRIWLLAMGLGTGSNFFAFALSAGLAAILLAVLAAGFKRSTQPVPGTHRVH